MDLAMKPRRRKKYAEFSLGFNSGKQRLFGRLWLPEGGRPVPAVILCHGFGTDHRTMRPIAKIIAGQGVAAFAFDFRGHGWSGGICDGNTPEDVIAAFNRLTSFPEIYERRIAVVGHSMGAGAALLAAPELKDVHGLVLISCPCPGEESVAFCQRLAQNTRGVAEYPRQGVPPWVRPFPGVSWAWMKVRGYRVAVDWVDWLMMLEANQRGMLSVALSRLRRCHVLFVHCRGDKSAAYQEVVKLYEHAQVPKEIILEPGGFHSAPLLPGRLRQRWVDWLISVLTRSSSEEF